LFKERSNRLEPEFGEPENIFKTEFRYNRLAPNLTPKSNQILIICICLEQIVSQLTIISMHCWLSTKASTICFPIGPLSTFPF